MKVLLAAFFVALAALGIASVNAQQAPAVTDNTALQKIMETELPPERMALAMKLVQLNGTTRVFDDILPTIADEAKNQFIRANPQMQLGIIGLVDTIAVQLVSRRPELDRYLARIWASGFTDEEMQIPDRLLQHRRWQEVRLKASRSAGRADLGCPGVGAVRRRRAECYAYRRSSGPPSLPRRMRCKAT